MERAKPFFNNDVDEPKEWRDVVLSEEKRESDVLKSPVINYPDNDEFAQIKQLSDEKLVDLYLEENNELAFNQLLNRYGFEVYKLALSITRSPNHAGGVLKHVFRVLENMDSFDSSKFSEWVYKITARESFSRFDAPRRRDDSADIGRFAS